MLVIDERGPREISETINLNRGGSLNLNQMAADATTQVYIKLDNKLFIARVSNFPGGGIFIDLRDAGVPNPVPKIVRVHDLDVTNMPPLGKSFFVAFDEIAHAQSIAELWGHVAAFG